MWFKGISIPNLEIEIGYFIKILTKLTNPMAMDQVCLLLIINYRKIVKEIGENKNIHTTI